MVKYEEFKCLVYAKQKIDVRLSKLVYSWNAMISFLAWNSIEKQTSTMYEKMRENELLRFDTKIE